MMPVRISGPDMSQISSGVAYAASNGAHVINLSVGIPGEPDPQWYTIFEEYASNYNCTIVCAVGNYGWQPIHFPARLESTLAVTSSNVNDDWSERPKGDEVDVAAPFRVVTTDLTGPYGRDSNICFWWEAWNLTCDENYDSYFGGTSSATPHVSGIVGLMLSINRGLSRFHIIDILKKSADKVGLKLVGNPPYDPIEYDMLTGHSQEFGYGRVDAFEAIQRSMLTHGIHITSPNVGDEVFTPGEIVPITWERTGPGTEAEPKMLKIHIYNETGFIRFAVPNNGLVPDTDEVYYWTVPSDLSTEHKYRVLIEEEDSGPIAQDIFYTDFSDRPFKVEQPTPTYINITWPINGEVLKYNNQYTFTWDTNLSEVIVELNPLIEILCPPLYATETIHSSTGQFTWTVPSCMPASPDYQLVLRSIDNSIIVTSTVFHIE